jgi:outer membrane protein OmpA-like peptidoglycan-associated protein
MILTKNSSLACAGLVIFCHCSLAADPSEPPTPVGNLTYVGSNGRIGLGYDSVTKLRGEAHWVVGEDASAAWITEGWVSGAAGGLKLNYHWVPAQKADTGPSLSTYKVFAAADRNAQLDAKFTLGGGIETEHLFFGATLSSALTGRRGVGSSTSSATETLHGTETDGREYFYDVVTTTEVRLFERPYDFGVGLRLGRYFDQPLLRLSGGLDYEWGADASHQTTLSVGLEKFIANSPHSVSLIAQAYQKTGPFETSRDDQRITVMYRYELGRKGYRAQREFRMVQAPVQMASGSVQDEATLASKRGAAAPASLASTAIVTDEKPAIAKRMVKTTATMLSDAFFVIDSDALTPEAKKALDPIVELLRKKAYSGNILLTGHTCDLGPASYNLALSQRRALSVKKYLTDNGGVPTDVILTDGKGSALPRFPNAKGSRFKNRRVDLQFVTFTEKLEDVVLPVATAPAPKVTPAPAPKEAPQLAAQVEWTREYIDTEPAWLRRSLHNTMSHKQSVDVYRQQERDVKVATGDKRYVNRAPSATMDAFTVNQDTTTPLDVLSNDSDPDGNPLKIISVATPAHGIASVSGSKVSYSPTVGFVGVDTFTYTIADDKGATSASQITITVLSTNRAPVAQNDAFAVNQDTATQLDVTANDSDPDGNPLKITTITTPAHGNASISGGKVSYTPVTGFVGVDTFTYTITDDKGATSSAVATVTVKSTNRAPVAQSDTFSLNQDTSALFDVLANDSDPDGNPLILTSVSAPAHGSASVSAGKVSYRPLPGYVGVDSFTYTIADDKGATSSAQASVTVKSTNRPPVARDDSLYVTAFGAVTLNVLANDFDPDGDTLSIVSFTQPSTGTITKDSNGYLVFTGLGSFLQTRFSYTISDGKGGTATASVTLIDP